MQFQWLYRHKVGGVFTEWKQCNAAAIEHMMGFPKTFVWEHKLNPEWST